MSIPCYWWLSKLNNRVRREGADELTTGGCIQKKTDSPKRKSPFWQFVLRVVFLSSFEKNQYRWDKRIRLCGFINETARLAGLAFDRKRKLKRNTSRPYLWFG